MTANDLLILVRQRLGDMQKLSLSDEELIMSLNVAIDRLSDELSQDNNPELVKELTLIGNNKTARPDDFISLCGQFPVVFIQDTDGIKVKHMDPNYTGSMIIRYFASRPHVTTLSDKIPFDKILQQRQLVTYTVYDIKSITGEVKENDGSGANG
jgi:hypothetical protein